MRHLGLLLAASLVGGASGQDAPAGETWVHVRASAEPLAAARFVALARRATGKNYWISEDDARTGRPIHLPRVIHVKRSKLREWIWLQLYLNNYAVVLHGRRRDTFEVIPRNGIQCRWPGWVQPRRLTAAQVQSVDCDPEETIIAKLTLHRLAPATLAPALQAALWPAPEDSRTWACRVAPCGKAVQLQGPQRRLVSAIALCQWLDAHPAVADAEAFVVLLANPEQSLELRMAPVVRRLAPLVADARPRLAANPQLGACVIYGDANGVASALRDPPRRSRSVEIELLNPNAGPGWPRVPRDRPLCPSRDRGRR